MATNDQVQTQTNRTIPTANGTSVPYNLDRFGNLGTNNWKDDLIALGYVWIFNTPVTGPDAGGDMIGLTGGGSGTTIDGDQPDFIISNSSTDWVMIPIDLRIHSMVVDVDADGEYAASGWFVDETQAYTSVTGTTVTPRNAYGGAGNMSPQNIPSTILAKCVVTVDITDPVLSQCLVADRIQAADTGTATSNATRQTNAVYLPEYRMPLKGASTILGYWGGTAAVTAIAKAMIAIVPASYFTQ